MKNTTQSATSLYKVAISPYMVITCIALNIFILLNNTTVLIIFIKLKKLKVQHCYMLALVITDLTVLVINTVQAAILISQEIKLTDTVCVLLGSLPVFSFTMTSIVHACLTIDRWTSVAHPITYRNFEYSQNSRKLTVTVIIAIQAVQALQQYLAWHYGQIDFYFDPYLPYWVPTSGANGRAGMILGLLFAFVLPFVIEVTLHVHIINIVRQMRSTTRTRTLKAVKTVLMTFGGYYICCIPMAVLTVLKGIVLTAAEPAEWLVLLAVQSLMFNSGMSGVIYYLTLPDFKETLMNIIYCQHN